MPKAVAEKTDPQRAALLEFVEAFKRGRKVGAPAANVERLRKSLAACREQDVAPWEALRSPLEAATDVALTISAAQVGEGLTLLWREQARDMRAALGHETAPALERPLIEHVCLCWLRLTLMELRCSAMTDNNTFKAIEHTDRRLAEAQKRFTRACEALARVRKMKLPALQINLAADGGQQINVA